MTIIIVNLVFVLIIVALTYTISWNIYVKITAHHLAEAVTYITFVILELENCLSGDKDSVSSSELLKMMNTLKVASEIITGKEVKDV